ncbi:DUF4435 domain-containing protein [Pusillimonas sp. MFBS29]|uniref:DUF4435 domain-containing protein n=1 Tax=Pusillimonas sp. MFBS29 TaxID=2886690 RepID=UPI001D1088E9|nr:DUF4435 domain-containing protein [Pusillimonas sp. MFBS29]MCC2594871.1 DUF4435 domain-containing protein [Pusillimonas sp. MFBS29]
MTAQLLERAREARKSPTVLKLRLSQLRSRFQEPPILIVEGVDDIGPYETWVNRVADICMIRMLSGNGKEQLLGLRTLLARDETELRPGVFFAVDRDFDELLGQESGPDIFCTDRYSVESYLVDEHVVASVLRDEFRLEEGSAEFDAAKQAYHRTLRDLVVALTSANFRIYCCRRLGVRLPSVTPEVRRFARIHVGRIEANVGPEVLDKELAVESQLPEEAVETLRSDFEQLDPQSRHRGKFLFQFLVTWVERLADEARNPSGEVFTTRLNIKFSSTVITHRSLASRSDLPMGFREFVTRMVAST